MPEKTQIIDELGERGLLRPSQVNQGLAANDRVKYYFTLLQAAVANATEADPQAATLGRERLACGVDLSHLDDVGPALVARRLTPIPSHTRARSERRSLDSSKPCCYLWREMATWRSTTGTARGWIISSRLRRNRSAIVSPVVRSKR